ncbi:hypothetical protein NDU88_003022 [Pleurodeles waltl]|uniref:Uncharacterized protein n=1 Tax=Pleurodeles waltl TaxID=8319 RepID=A0AAV7MTD6_PLEWA|nr:hypothetical protein NDU88_003022 [Pleurodeles waltl]
MLTDPLQSPRSSGGSLCEPQCTVRLVAVEVKARPARLSGSARGRSVGLGVLAWCFTCGEPDGAPGHSTGCGTWVRCFADDRVLPARPVCQMSHSHSSICGLPRPCRRATERSRGAWLCVVVASSRVASRHSGCCRRGSWAGQVELVSLGGSMAGWRCVAAHTGDETPVRVHRCSGVAPLEILSTQGTERPASSQIVKSQAPNKTLDHEGGCCSSLLVHNYSLSTFPASGCPLPYVMRAASTRAGPGGGDDVTPPRDREK